MASPHTGCSSRPGTGQALTPNILLNHELEGPRSVEQEAEPVSHAFVCVVSHYGVFDSLVFP